MHSDTEQLEQLIYLYKAEKDLKKKHVLYLNLVEESLKLVNRIVLTVYPIPVTVSREDLAQVGAMGLLRAINTYKVQEKGSFKTYASKFIKGKILHYLRDKANLVKTPRDTSEKINVVKNYIESLDSNITPTVKDIANALHMQENKVQDILNADLAKNVISLDQKVYSMDGMETLIDRIQADENDNSMDNFDNKKIIEFALDKLKNDEKIAIYKYYIEGCTKKSIAELLKVSQTQVARLIKRALNKMYVIISNDMNFKEG